MEFETDPEIEALCPPLDDETYEALKKDIEKNNIQTDLFVSVGTPGIEDGTILCGHTRYKIWTDELHRPVNQIPYKEKKFSCREEAIEFSLNDNIHRRQLTEWEKCEIISKREDFAKAVMRLRMEQGARESGLANVGRRRNK